MLFAVVMLNKHYVTITPVFLTYLTSIPKLMVLHFHLRFLFPTILLESSNIHINYNCHWTHSSTSGFIMLIDLLQLLH